jgi:hypothetical protein
MLIFHWNESSRTTETAVLNNLNGYFFVFSPKCVTKGGNPLNFPIHICTSRSKSGIFRQWIAFYVSPTSFPQIRYLPCRSIRIHVIYVGISWVGNSTVFLYWSSIQILSRLNIFLSLMLKTYYAYSTFDSRRTLIYWSSDERLELLRLFSRFEGSCLKFVVSLSKKCGLIAVVCQKLGEWLINQYYSVI